MHTWWPQTQDRTSWWSSTTWCNSCSGCMNASVCALAQTRVGIRRKAAQVPHSRHVRCTECRLKWSGAPGKQVVFTHASAATVKFAHSHAFFVSLTFHVEAKASPGAIFRAASLTQWGHTTQNLGNVKNDNFKSFWTALWLSDEGRLLEWRGQNRIQFYNDTLLHLRPLSPSTQLLFDFLKGLLSYYACTYVLNPTEVCEYYNIVLETAWLINYVPISDKGPGVDSMNFTIYLIPQNQATLGLSYAVWYNCPYDVAKWAHERRKSQKNFQQSNDGVKK